MNKILMVCRRVKGLTTEQMAKILEITEPEYRQIEHSAKDLSIKQAIKLEKIFDIESEWFYYDLGRPDYLIEEASQELLKLVGDVKPDEPVLSPMGLKVIAMGYSALRTVAECRASLQRQLELTHDNNALKRMVQELSA